MNVLLRRSWVMGLVSAALAVVAYAALAGTTVVINYKLTLTADTPDGPKTGSGVIQVSYGSQFNLNGGGYKPDFHVTGEAIPLELGRGKILFVTLTNAASGRPGTPGRFDGAMNAANLPIGPLGLSWPYGEEEKLRALLSTTRNVGPQSVAFQNLPTLVTFRDLGDPLSVELVQPEKLSDIFGDGFVLKKSTVEITDEQVDTRIERILSWLPIYKKGGALDGREFPGPNDPLTSQLGYLSFKNWGI